VALYNALMTVLFTLSTMDVINHHRDGIGYVYYNLVTKSSGVHTPS